MTGNLITITVTGPAASGKSAIAQQLTTELRRFGMTVRNFDEDPPRHDLQLEHVLTEIGPKTHISIFTIRRFPQS